MATSIGPKLIPSQFHGTFIRQAQGGRFLYYMFMGAACIGCVATLVALLTGSFFDTLRMGAIFLFLLLVFRAFSHTRIPIVTTTVTPDFIKIEELAIRIDAKDIELDTLQSRNQSLPRPMHFIEMQTKKKRFFLRLGQVHWLGNNLTIVLDVPK